MRQKKQVDVLQNGNVDDISWLESFLKLETGQLLSARSSPCCADICPVARLHGITAAALPYPNLLESWLMTTEARKKAHPPALPSWKTQAF